MLSIFLLNYYLYLCIKHQLFAIMTQILVTLNEDATTQSIRKAIEMLRGVVSTSIMKTKSTDTQKTLAQQKYVKESLERAINEVKAAKEEGKELQTADDFIKELQMEDAV